MSPGGREAQDESWIVQAAVSNVALVQQFTATKRIHQGEAEAIVLAVEKGADLGILDDHEARVVAKAQGLAITGTVGVLIEAKTQGFIP